MFYRAVGATAALGPYLRSPEAQRFMATIRDRATLASEPPDP